MRARGFGAPGATKRDKQVSTRRRGDDASDEVRRPVRAERSRPMAITTINVVSSRAQEPLHDAARALHPKLVNRPSSATVCVTCPDGNECRPSGTPAPFVKSGRARAQMVHPVSTRG